MIEQDTNDIAEEIAKERDPFSFTIGSVLRQMDQSQMNKPFEPKTELQLFLEFMSANNLRLVDVFGDSPENDETGSVTIEEFIARVEVTHDI